MCKFLSGEPALVAASELNLVAILLGLHAAHDRAELWEFNLADAGKLVFHLLLLRLNLLLVRQVLPFATAADAEVLAHRLLTDVAFFDEANHLRLAVLMFLLDYLQIYHITWHTERDEDDLVVYSCDALTLGCNSLDGDVSKRGNGLRFLAIILICFFLWVQRYGNFMRNARVVPNYLRLKVKGV